MLTNLTSSDRGIYKITDSLTGMVYIGSSVCLEYRRRNHFNLLRKGMHRNQIMQAAFSSHGEDCFSWEVVERIEGTELELRQREDELIRTLESNHRGKGFNIREVCYNNKNVPGTGKIVKGAENYKAIPYHLLDARTGIEYRGKCVAEFCRQHGIPDASGYFVLVRGDINVWRKRYVVPGSGNTVKKYQFRHRETGDKAAVYDLGIWCATLGLSPNQMARVHRGERPSHRGWEKHNVDA